MATATPTVGGARPVAMATRVASAEEAVQKYGQHLATPAAQGESTVPLPKEFEELRQRTLALQEEEYWVAHWLQDEALEFRLQAVAFVRTAPSSTSSASRAARSRTAASSR